MIFDVAVPIDETAPHEFVLSPAYGRDYTRESDVLENWHAERDWVIQRVDGLPWRGGRYINRQQVPAGSTVMIRYNKLAEVAEFTVPA